MWTQHGGSGLGLALADALELSVSDRDWLLDRVHDERAREARELTKAARRG
jgi:heme exporter protein D